MTFSRHVQNTLEDLRSRGILRHPRIVSSDQGPVITIDGSPVLSLCSNNYLGLANHPAITEAAAAALREHGYGTGASRHISGTHTLHLQAQEAFARFCGRDAALFFATGYAANTGAIQALVGRDDVIFSDRLNHASLIDGCLLSRAKTHVYQHADPQHLETLLRAHRADGKAALVVTDAAFSMDGDLAPLVELRRICNTYDAGLMVDEAHSMGVLGPSGSGLCAHLEVIPDVVVGTLGKAFGTAGAFVAGDTATVHLIENRARSYVFSTAPSPSQAAAALAAITLVQGSDERRTRVHANARTLRTGLSEMGVEVLPGSVPILPVLTRDPALTMELSARLLEAGVFVHGIRPPTVPRDGSRLRVTTTAAHDDQHIARALEAFEGIVSMIHA